MNTTTIAIAIAIFLIIGGVFLFSSKSSPQTLIQPTKAPQPDPSLVFLQTRINDIVSGKTSLSNLKVLNLLVVNNNNNSDQFTLKLISKNSNNKNAIVFSRSTTQYNTFGIHGNYTPLQKTFTLSKPINIASTPPTISSLQTQINNILNGKQPLNNLKVNGSVTVKSLRNYPIILNNSLNSTNKYNDCVLFVKNDKVQGYYGTSKTYVKDNLTVFDYISTENLSYSNTNWDARPTLPTCAPINLNVQISSFNSTNISDINAQLDNIINGSTPIYNLTVNGDMTVTGDSDTLLIIDNFNCDPTNLINFNDLAGRGLNAYGGPFDWINWIGTGTTLNQ